MRLYTKTGDKGQTSVIGGRVDKDDVRVEAYGTVDEANSFVGKARTELDLSIAALQKVDRELERIQHELFDCGGDLANKKSNRAMKLEESSVQWLEERMDDYIQQTPELKRFILPGGADAAATLHIARTVTRRAERQVVSLMKCEEASSVCLQYLNRLSDYFFAISRYINFVSGKADVEYIRSEEVFRSKPSKKQDEQ